MKMKSLTMLLCSVFMLTGIIWAQAGSDLRNQDVVSMASIGLSDEVILDKIHSASATDFDTSIEGLKALKNAKVSDAVIRAMINPKAAFAPSTVQQQSTSPQTPQLPAGFPQTATVAYKEPDGSYLKLEPPFKYSGKPQEGAFGPFGKTKIISVYKGSTAPIRIAERRPSFYVRQVLVNTRSLFIVALTRKGDHRELPVGSTNFFENHQVGISDKYRIEVVVEGKPNGVFYKITPKEDLPDGEYVIALDDLAANSYDFGISGATVPTK